MCGTTMDHQNIVDFVIKEEFEIKQEEEEDTHTIYEIIEFEHIFEPDPIKEEFQEESKIYSDIKLEPICHDHNYACSPEPKHSRTKNKSKTEHRSSKPRICSICDEQFVRVNAFERHLLSHGTTRSQFECDICGAKIKRKENLRHHIMTVHVESEKVRVPCSICAKGFDPKYVRLHESTHNVLNQEPSLECSICDKKFHTRINLSAHIRRHRAKKTAPCNVCGKSFAVPGPLRVHQRLHTGEKV